jgi:hypothetical protein
MVFKSLRLTLLALLCGGTRLFAQLQVSIELDRDSYVNMEPTIATVTVLNQAGKDIVLGGPSGGSWLQMDMRELAPGHPEGRMISGRGGQEPRPSTVVLKDGAITQRKIDLQAYYDMAPGQYAVNCAVYFSDLDRWIGPKDVTTLLIASPRKPLFSQTVGMSTASGGSSYRKYKIFGSPCTFKENGKPKPRNLLYFQLADEVTDETIMVYPLGELLRVYEPQPAVDVENNLHVVYQTTPKLFSHAVLTPTGVLKSFEQHETVGSSRPTLMRSPSGQMAVKGGKFYDPKLQALINQQRATEQRALSDRPPGLPEEKPKR